MDKLLDTQEPLPLTFLNTVVCLNKQDLNRPDQWLISNPQANMAASQVGMAVLHNNLQLDMEVNQWAMEVRQALEDMDEVNRPPLVNGASQPPKASATVSADIKARSELVCDMACAE